MEKLLLQAMLLCATHFQRQESVISTIHQQLLYNLGPLAEEFEVGAWFLSCPLIYLYRPLRPGITNCPLPGPTLCYAGRVPESEQERTKLQSDCSASSEIGSVLTLQISC